MYKEAMSKKELLEILNVLDDDDLIYFNNGDLSFYRIKKRGEKLYQFEFNEAIKVVDSFD